MHFGHRAAGQDCLVFPSATSEPDFVSRDASATASRLTELLGRPLHVSPLDTGGFEARLTGRSLVDAQIVWVDFPNGLKVSRAQPKDNLTVLFLEQGSCSFSFDSRTLVCPEGGAVALNTAIYERVVYTAGARGLLLTLPMATVAELMGSLFDRPATRKLEIAAAFDASSPIGATLMGLITIAAAGLREGAPFRSSAHAARLLRDSVVMTLLENLPHNYSGWFGRQAESLPWQIRQAVDYIAANIDGELTVQQVAEAVGSSVRSLQQGFQRHRNTSPHAHLKAVRLARVRAELLDAASRRSVEDIARHWGFINRGHFAVEYRRTFGELPSETRRSR